MNNIDSLCNQLLYSQIEYDEFQELKNSLNADFNINNTIERYHRYIRCITIWKVNDVCFEHIKDLILEFLNNKEAFTLVVLSRKIDTELIYMLNSL